MKILVALLVLVLGGQVALAQEAECYIEDSKGRKVDLGGICGRPANVNPGIVSGGEKVIRIPIKNRRGNTPIVDITFNGNQTFEMILDTGATGTVITQAMASSLKIRPFTSIRAQVADGSTVIFPVGFVQSIGVVGATVKNIPVAIAAEIQVGLLGNDFLNGYDVKIKRDSIELYQR